MNRLKSIGYALPSLVMSAGIFYFSSLPQPPFVASTFQWQDKVLHFGAYLVYGFTLALACHNIAFRTLGIKIVSILAFGILYGASDEVHQYFVPGRSTELGDWIADILGIILSVIIYTLLVKRSTRKLHLY